MPKTPSKPRKDHRRRMGLTLSPEAFAALDRFTEVTGYAASSFCAQVIEDSLPVVEAMTQAFIKARTSPVQAAKIMDSEFVRTLAHAAQTKLAFEDSARQRKPRKSPR